MKKKVLECPVHGPTLFRCKRVCCQDSTGKWSSSYTERCFKCIAEGVQTKKGETGKRSKFVSFRA